MKKIIALLLAVLICVAMVGCNTNPTNNSDYSNNESDIIIEEIITETVVSNTESKVESTPSENVVSNTSSQTENANQETKNVIPEGGIYACTSKGVVLTAGQEWPTQCEEYDTYTYGDYKYVYNVGIVISDDTNQDTPDKSTITIYDNNIVGWVVNVLDKSKTAYGEILGNVNGKPVVSMGMMETKDGVFTREGTFGGCTHLVAAPEIPNTVVNMYEAFFMCESLVKAPQIPNSVVYLRATFALCKSLKEAPQIPSSVTNMRSALADCPSLTGTITINANPTSYERCFANVDMSKITLTGSATKETLNNLGATGENYTPIS